VETLSGAAEVQLVGDCDEVPEVPKFHVEMVADGSAFVVGCGTTLSTTAECVCAATT
jgi:hypothetical protein